MKKVVNWLLEKLGYTFQSLDVLASKQRELDALTALYQSRYPVREYHSPFPAECIIFSMDRALQLHALVSSYLDLVSNPVPVHILYRTSSDLHQKAYDELMALFPGQNIFFVRQKSSESFREQTLQLLESIQAGKLFFLVDDIVFLNSVEMSDFAKFDPHREVASLRLGEHLKSSYAVQQKQALPPWINGVVPDKDKLCWNWKDGELEWAYPISLDGHLFATEEIRAMARVISFTSPTYLEGNLQIFKEVFSCRYGICYSRSKIVNIPLNKVQQDSDNLSGNIHQDELLNNWLQGMQMDYRQLFSFQNESVHEEIPISVISRKSSG